MTLLLLLTLFACNYEINQSKNEIKVFEISVDQSTFKSEYLFGESFQSDAKLKIYYTDYTYLYINLSIDMTEGFDTTTTGRKTLIINYGNKTTSVYYTVSEPAKVKYVSLSSDNVLSYSINDTFKGANITIEYEDGVKRKITLSEDLVNGFRTDISGPFNLSFNYLGFDLSFDIIVNGNFSLNDFLLSYDSNFKYYKVLNYSGNASDVVFPSSVNNIPIGYIESGILCENFANITHLSLPFIGSTLDNPSSFEYLIGDNPPLNIKSKIELTLLPNYLTNIPDNYLSNQKYFNSVILPNSIKSIGNYAFAYSSIVTVIIPDSVLSIGDYAFTSASALKYLNIPESVREIGTDAFLTNATDTTLNLELSSNYLTIDYNEQTYADLFKSCKSIIVPDNIYNNTLSNLNLDSTIIYRASDIKIIDDSFLVYDDTILLGYIGKTKEIIIPDGITTIDNFAFCNFEITNIEFPESIVSIKAGSFKDSIYYNFELPSTIKNIDGPFFSGRVLILNTIDLTNIDNFLSDDTLIVIVPDVALKPYKVKFSSDSDKFYHKSYYNTIEYIIKNNVLKVYLKDNADVTIPSYVKVIDDKAFMNSKSLKTVIVPVDSDLVKIGNSSFFGCTNLQSISIPYNLGLETIGTSAFSGCESLTSIDIPYNIKSIGENVFLGAYNLETINMQAKFSDGINFSGGINEFTNLGNNLYANLLWSESNVASIEFTEGVQKIYFVDDEFNKNGEMIVSYENGYTIVVEIIDYITTQINLTVPGEFDVPISFDSYDTSYKINVLTNELISVSLKANSLKMTYNINDNIEGVLVETYLNSDMIEVPITPKMVENFDTSMSRRLTITISHKTFSDDFEILILGEFIKDYFKLSFDPVENYYMVLEYVGDESNIIVPAYVNSTPIGFIQNGIFNNVLRFATSITLPFVGESLTNQNGLSHLITLKANGSLRYEQYYGKLTITVLSDFITSTSSQIFMDSQWIGKVILSEGITKIDSYAFSQANYLKTVILPSTLLYINSNAFSSCQRLSYIELPLNLRLIDTEAFSNCQILNYRLPQDTDNITFGDDWNTSTLQELNSSLSIEIIDDTYVIYDETILLTNLNQHLSGEITLSNSKITSISAYAFLDNYYITNFNLTDSITSIDRYAFSGCRFSHLNLPISITSLGVGFFSGRVLIINSSNSAKSLCEWSHFEDSYMAVVIPDEIYIQESFSNMQIPNMFFISHSYYDKNNFIITNQILQLYLKDEDIIHIPPLSIIIESWAFKYSKAHQIVFLDFLPLDIIKRYAFASCDNLTALTVHVRYAIESYAFMDCVNLQNLTISISEASENFIVDEFIVLKCFSLKNIQIETYTQYKTFDNSNTIDILNYDEEDIDVIEYVRVEIIENILSPLPF
jgi:hypothetical protein